MHPTPTDVPEAPCALADQLGDLLAVALAQQRTAGPPAIRCRCRRAGAN